MWFPEGKGKNYKLSPSLSPLAAGMGHCQAQLGPDARATREDRVPDGAGQPGRAGRVFGGSDGVGERLLNAGDGFQIVLRLIRKVAVTGVNLNCQNLLSINIDTCLKPVNRALQG